LARKHPKQTHIDISSDGKKGRPGKPSNKEFERHLAKLQAELVKVQPWVQHVGLKVVLIFEGRDAVGKCAPTCASRIALPATSTSSRAAGFLEMDAFAGLQAISLRPDLS
jgi:Polyphosphate kinase 2 (PPK2)